MFPIAARHYQRIYICGDIEGRLYYAPKIPTRAPHVIAELAPDVMAGLDPAIGYPHQFANDAIPVSNQVEPSHDVLACGTSTIGVTGITNRNRLPFFCSISLPHAPCWELEVPLRRNRHIELRMCRSAQSEAGPRRTGTVSISGRAPPAAIFFSPCARRPAMSLIRAYTASGADHPMYDPPLTCRTWPVIALASSEARNTAVRAT